MATAVISTATTGATLLAAPATGHRRVVEGLHFICDAAVAVTLSVAGSSVTGAMSFPANGGMSTDDAGFDLAAGQALTVTLGSANGIRGWLKYRDVELPG